MCIPKRLKSNRKFVGSMRCLLSLLFVLSVFTLIPKAQILLGASDVQVDGENHLKNVKFKIIDGSTGEPIRNRELNICQFVYFKLKPGAPSPYLDKKASWYIRSVTTDDNGVFTLDLSLIDTMAIAVEPAEPYNIVRFTRTSGGAQEGPPDHISIFEEGDGTSRNLWYDLKRKIVRIIPTYGQKDQRKPYEEIVLITRKTQSSENSDEQVDGGGFGQKHEDEQGNAYLDAIIAGDLRTVGKLLANNPSLISIIDDRGKRSSGLPALYLSIKYGHAEIVELLLSKGAKPNERDIHGQGSLHMAAKNGRANLVRILVDYGADINGGKNGFRHPPLCYASNAQVAEALIKNGADVNWRDKRRATPLHSIARSGITTAAEVLLAHGADINTKDNSGWTPLHGASSRCQKEMIELLIAKGADINAKDRRARGATPLNRAVMDDWCTKSERKEAAELLLSLGADFTIYDVVWLGDVKRVRELLKDTPSLAGNASNAYREPVLFAAIRQGHSAIVELLLDNGAELNVKGRHKEPPLHAVAYAGHKNMAALLIRKGADVNRKGAHGELALHWAVVKGHGEMAQLLVKEGTEVNTKTDKQRVDMDTIVEADADVVCEWLKFLANKEKQEQAMAAGSSLQIMGPLRLAFADEDTALHSAAQWGHKEIAESLLANGADVDTTNRWGQTPLHYAVVFRHAEVVKALLNAGANPDAKMLDGSTAHDLASKVKDTGLADMLRVDHDISRRAD